MGFKKCFKQFFILKISVIFSLIHVFVAIVCKSLIKRKNCLFHIRFSSLFHIYFYDFLCLCSIMSKQFYLELQFNAKLFYCLMLIHVDYEGIEWKLCTSLNCRILWCLIPILSHVLYRTLKSFSENNSI